MWTRDEVEQCNVLTMTSISTRAEQSGNEAPRPQLVISRDDDYGRIITVAYLPDGRAVTGSASGAVRICNLQTGEQEGMSMDHEGGVIDLAVTRDGAKIISSDIDGEIKVWDVESHKLVKAWTYQEEGPAVAISPNDRFMAAGGWTVGIYTTEGKWVNSVEVGCDVFSLSFSPDGNKLVCGTEGDIRIYDFKVGTLILGPLKGHEDRITSVLWSRDGRRLFSASDDKTVRCWNSGTGEQIGQPWTGHTRWIYSLCLSPDGRLLASASLDQTVRFWDTAHGHPVGQHLQHVTTVSSVCFSPSGEFVASGGRRGNIYLWRVPQLDSGEGQVIIITHIRSPSSSALIVLCVQKMSFADLDPPSNTLFLPPPSYSMQIPRVEQSSDPGPGVGVNSSQPECFSRSLRFEAFDHSSSYCIFYAAQLALYAGPRYQRKQLLRNDIYIY